MTSGMDAARLTPTHPFEDREVSPDLPPFSIRLELEHRSTSAPQPACHCVNPSPSDGGGLGGGENGNEQKLAAADRIIANWGTLGSIHHPHPDPPAGTRPRDLS